MGSNAQGHPKSIFRRIPKLTYVCLLLAAALLCFLIRYLTPSDFRADVRMPPDLTNSTGLEIRYFGECSNTFSQILPGTRQS